MAVYIMSNSAVENYGEEYRGVRLEVVHTATRYMPAKEFYRKGMPNGYHPGYDESANNGPLYDLRELETGKDLEFSLYSWELKKVKVNPYRRLRVAK